MTNEEFDIIDELYFVTAYNDLKHETGLTDDQLKGNLSEMIKKGWVRVYKNVNEESEIEKLNIDKDFRSFYYLASKKGLFEHNSQ